MIKALLPCALTVLATFACQAQATKTIQVQVRPSTSLLPLAHPSSKAQIREYLADSGELEAYRLRWISAVDKNRSIGAPYWPEAFWISIKDSMRNADLVPMYITWYQHTVSEELMARVLDTYKDKGQAGFTGTPACFALGVAQIPFESEMDKLTLANTLSVIQQVYAVFKPQISEARIAYLAAHPDYIDR